MARIRSIKPEFFTHEDLYEAEMETCLPLRLAFAGLWCVADREGRFKWRPRQIKLDVLPYDDIDFSRVLDALLTRGFLVKYVSPTGDELGWIPSFGRHQVINNRERQSDLPSPDECRRIKIIPSENNEIDASSTRQARVIDASSTRESHDGHAASGEGKGREGKGREVNKTPETVVSEPAKAGTTKNHSPRREVVIDPTSGTFILGVEAFAKYGINDRQARQMVARGLRESDALTVDMALHRIMDGNFDDPKAWFFKVISNTKAERAAAEAAAVKSQGSVGHIPAHMII